MSRKTFLQAALIVLADASGPLTSTEITTRALDRKLLLSAGRTPEASMSAALYVEAKRPDSRVTKRSKPGPTRAARNSVRWVLSGR